MLARLFIYLASKMFGKEIKKTAASTNIYRIPKPFNLGTSMEERKLNEGNLNNYFSNYRLPLQLLNYFPQNI